MKIRFQRKQDGIALIIVMLVIMTLTTLAAGFALSMKVEMKLAAQANYDQAMELIGRSGAQWAVMIMTEQDKLPGPKVHSLGQMWAGGPALDATNSPLADIHLGEAVEVGQGSFVINAGDIVDLERKFNINTAVQNPGILQQAMLTMGVDASTSPGVCDAILDWIDPDNDSHTSGPAENDYYLGLDPPYYCKNGPVDEMTELLLVKNVTPDIFWGSSSTNTTVSRYQPRENNSPSFMGDQMPTYLCGLNDLFTTLSAGRINVNTATTNTLRMIFGGDENIANAVINLRSGGAAPGATQQSSGVTGGDTPFLRADDLVRNVPGLTPLDTQRINALCDVRSFAFEVTIHVTMGEYTKDYVAIIRRLGNNSYAVLTFHGK